MTTLREQLRCANNRMNILELEKRILQSELDRQRIGLGKIILTLAESYPTVNIFDALNVVITTESKEKE